MKKTAFTLLLVLLGALVQAQADNILENSNFQDGISHWYGNGQSAADAASQGGALPSAPSATAAPPSGLVVQLRSRDWDKVCQDFRTRAGPVTVSVTYTVSPDLKFSDKPALYANMPGNINFNAWQPFATSVGKWILMVCDIAGGHSEYCQISPEPAIGKQSTETMTIPDIRSDAEKTLVFAFPPGSGTVTLLNVTLDGHP